MYRFSAHLPQLVHALIGLLICLSMLGNNLFNRKTLVILLVLSLVDAWKKLPYIVIFAARLWPLLLLLLWCLLTSEWSRWPLETLESVIIQTLLLFCCLNLALGLGSEKLVSLLNSAAIGCILLNLLYIISHSGTAFSWQGLVSFYYSKNNMGLVMAVCSILLLFGTKHPLKYLMLMISLSLLVASNSKTSMMLFVGSSVLSWLFTQPQKIQVNPKIKMQMYTACQLAGILLMIFFANQQAAFLDYIYYQLDDELLTGRGKLWAEMILHAEHHLLTGFGFEAVWGGEQQSEIYFTDLYNTNSIWVDKIVSSDGGYVDLLVSIGIVGLSLVLLLFIHCAFLASSIADRSTSRPFIALILLTIGHNITESTFLLSTNMLWFLFLLSTSYLACAPRRLYLRKEIKKIQLSSKRKHYEQVN